MTYRGHIAGGAAAGIAVAALAAPGRPEMLLAYMLFGVFGGVLPDFDAPGAFVTRRFLPIRWAMVWSCSNPLVWAVLGRRLLPHGPTGARTPVWARGLARALVPWAAAERHVLLAERLAVGRLRTRRLLGHRALSHSLVAAAVLALGWGLLGVAAVGHMGWLRQGVGGLLDSGWLVGAVGLGVLSHIGLDMLTVSGVPVLLPWRGRRYFLLPPLLRIRSV